MDTPRSNDILGIWKFPRFLIQGVSVYPYSRVPAHRAAHFPPTHRGMRLTVICLNTKKAPLFARYGHYRNSRTDRRLSCCVVDLSVPGVSAGRDIGLIVSFVCLSARMARPVVTLFRSRGGMERHAGPDLRCVRCGLARWVGRRGSSGGPACQGADCLTGADGDRQCLGPGAEADDQLTGVTDHASGQADQTEAQGLHSRRHLVLPKDQPLHRGAQVQCQDHQRPPGRVGAEQPGRQLSAGEIGLHQPRIAGLCLRHNTAATVPDSPPCRSSVASMSTVADVTLRTPTHTGKPRTLCAAIAYPLVRVLDSQTEPVSLSLQGQREFRLFRRGIQGKANSISPRASENHLPREDDLRSRRPQDANRPEAAESGQ